MAKPTPGPWVVELNLADEGDINVVQEGYTDGSTKALPVTLIDCRETHGDPELPSREAALANARLIAAAPELAEALRLFLNSCIAEFACTKEKELARAALAKAGLAPTAEAEER